MNEIAAVLAIVNLPRHLVTVSRRRCIGLIDGDASHLDAVKESRTLTRVRGLRSKD